LPNGEKVTASSTERSDLFYGAASSFGTLGVTTLLEVQLIDAKAYVELTYHPVSSILEAVGKMEDATDDSSIDYLDGIMYSRDSGVICSGRLTNDVNGVQIQRFTRSTDRWFYLHAKKLIKGTAVICQQSSSSWHQGS
jgi:delta24-sterol reductase